jgi:N-glycosidase YbiA
MEKVIQFCKINEPYGCFSNFSPHAVFIDGTTWTTVEHYFQASKFIDSKLRFSIQMAKSPLMAARMGRDTSHDLRSDWEEIKESVMRKAIRAKIIQHSDVRETLLKTSNEIIVEHTPRDSYWGDGPDGTGKNMLGKIYMDIREELTLYGQFDELSSLLLPPWEKYPEIERTSIGWRMGYGEDYFSLWSPWYQGLSEPGKKKYQAMYPEPKDWKGFYLE